MKSKFILLALVLVCISAYSSGNNQNDSTATGEKRRNPKTTVNPGTGTPTGERTRNPNKQNTTKSSESLTKRSANRNTK